MAHTHESRNQIVERFLHLIKPIALSLKQRLPASFDVDDLISMGTFGLMAAADRYDDGREETFEQYARQKIRGAILDGCKRDFRNATCASIDDDVYQLRAPAPLVDEQMQLTETHDQVRSAVASLTGRQQNVIALRFNRNFTQTEAGAALGGISQAGARDLEIRAIRSLRRRLAAA